jgi:carbamoyltransferase
MSNAKPWILGLSSAFHNGAACLLRGDEIVAAIQEERLTRVKRERLRLSGPSLAIDYCLSAGGIAARDLDMIVDCTISKADQSPADELRGSPIVQSARAGVATASIPHHLGHAYSAYATSGFDESLVLVVDGGGSFIWQLPAAERNAAMSIGDGMCEHASIYHCTAREFVCIEKHMARVPYILYKNHQGMLPFATIGHMYASVSKQIFGDYLEAGKVMGLAPYGRETIPVDDFLAFDGREFAFHGHVPQRFPHDERWPSRQAEYHDLAASTQRALEYALQALLSSLERGKLSRNLCYAGGVALNSVANHKIFRKSAFDGLHIIPAAEDSGPAIGAAYFGLAQLSRRNRGRRISTDFLGRTYGADEIVRALEETPGVRRVETEQPVELAADLLCAGKIVAWFDGGSEFGPRALGHRSILCDPRRPDAKALLNTRVKHREPFRPFAPIVLAEHLGDWFETDGHYPAMDFMLAVCPIRQTVAGKIPGVVHVDGTGRLQTIVREDNPRMHELLSAFHRRTGVPMLINTSLNVMGEPLVETPADALRSLLTTGIDYCFLENILVSKDDSRASVLELIPVVERDVRLDAAGPGSVAVATAHGPWVYRNLPSDLLELVGCIDGKSTGREILRRGGGAIRDEAAFASQLGLLARYSIIRFIEHEPRSGTTIR